MRRIYLIGSLRNEQVQVIAQQIRERTGHTVYDDWFSAGPKADDHWQEHQNYKGLTFKEALAGEAAQHVFHFDKKFLDRSDTVVLLLPAGKSGHLEFGYAIGHGSEGFILFDAVPERYDVMYNFASEVFFNVDELIERLR